MVVAPTGVASDSAPPEASLWFFSLRFLFLLFFPLLGVVFGVDKD